MTCCNSSIVDGLLEVKEQYAVEDQNIRTDLQAQIDTLTILLSSAREEISQLGESLRKAAASSETTYATKEALEALRVSTEQSRDQMHASLRSAIDAVDLEKATRAQ